MSPYLGTEQSPESHIQTVDAGSSNANLDRAQVPDAAKQTQNRDDDFAKDVSSLTLPEGDDGDFEDGDFVPGHAPSTYSEKRRAQNAIFDSWLTTPAAHAVVKSATKKERRPDQIGQDERSIHELLAKQQSTQIVKNPREYQLELFERAKKENTIAVLDTGSGKTLIAVLLLRWIIDKELEERKDGRPAKVGFFLCCSVALAYQQFSVLESNLDHKILKFCGNDGAEQFSRSTWQHHFNTGKVIVCTPAILYQCLSRGYISMRQINILIFDEAHHAKKLHYYAQIIKDYFLAEPDFLQRPRIFGMTASPIDAKTGDIHQAVFDLETLLQCRIATTTDMSLAKSVHKPQESVWQYAPTREEDCQTPFLRFLRSKYGEQSVFEGVFERAAQIAAHLGIWCADNYLINTISLQKCQRYQQSAKKKLHGASTVEDYNKAMQEVVDVIDYVQLEGERFTASSTRDLTKLLHDGKLTGKYHADNIISRKVAMLWHNLAQEFERETDYRCIVFVDQKQTARLLARLFKILDAHHLKADFVVGSSSSNDLEDGKFSFRNQVLSLSRFRRGQVNCLFATSVAEEGLDVPDCNLVVRFDIYKTMIQYVQSRGRARKRNSKFIHMIQKDNSIHRNLISEVFSGEQQMRDFCNNLPADREIAGNQGLEQLLDSEVHLEVYQEKSTGAKLTYANAMNVLAHFVSAIPTNSEEPQHPTYVVLPYGSEFVSEVVLPGESPIPSAIGKVRRKKALAKRSAAFSACMRLRHKKFLDEQFLPIYQKKLPMMRNALLASGMKKCSQYKMRTKPTVWEETRGTIPSEVFVTLIDLTNGPLERPHKPLLLLTRTPMPQFPTFPMYLHNGNQVMASSIGLTTTNGALALSSEMFKKITKFTYMVFEDVFSKRYKYKDSEDAAAFSYWLCPSSLTIDDARRASRGISSLQNIMDMSIFDQVYYDPDVELKAWNVSAPIDSLLNKFIVDTWDGTRKYYSLSHASHLQPIDILPADAGDKRKNGRVTILDYSCSMWRNRKEQEKWVLDQPVFVAEQSPYLARRNLLSRPNASETRKVKSLKQYICLQSLRVSPLPPSVAYTCFFWPGILHRFESCLIALEGCRIAGVECSPEHALAAFTKDSDNSDAVAPGVAAVNFQAGMGENYERLEFLGDTFLKVATTISTFIMNPYENEFEFHVRRMLMLCNKNLFDISTSEDLRLYEYVRSMSFSRRLWYPEGLTMTKGTGLSKEDEKIGKVILHDPHSHNLSQKTIADVSEALIGASILYSNRPGRWTVDQWDNAVSVVSRLVKNKDHPMTVWSDYSEYYNKNIPKYQTGDVTATQQYLADTVATEHSYNFRFPRLAQSAFIHPSTPFVHHQLPNYQRLEFLGDALLDMAAVTHVFYRHPDKDPHWLTEHKMPIASNRFLGALCVKIGFHKHLRHNHAELDHQIRDYVVQLEEARAAAQELAKEQPDRLRDYWTTVPDPPKCLPDIVEAFVGAMFIDSGFNYTVVQDFFDQHIKFFFEDVTLYDTYVNAHPVTRMHEVLQTQFGCGDFQILTRAYPGGEEEDGREKSVLAAALMVHDRVVESTVTKGTSGRYARIRVAKMAVEFFEGMSLVDFRARWGCDCRDIVTSAPC